MSNREHAPAWYITAARADLDAAGFPAADTYYDTGRTPGVYADVLHAKVHGRVNVLVSLGTKRHLHGTRPRPGRTRDAWNAACDQVADVLNARGYGEPFRHLMGLTLDTPPPPVGPVVELAPSPVLGDVGTFSARILGHEGLAATITANFHVSTSPAHFTITGQTGPMGDAYETPEEAAQSYARLCGFPPPTIRRTA